MKQVGKFLAVTMFGLMFILLTGKGSAGEKPLGQNLQCREEVILTKKQKQKLNTLYDELFAKKKEIFATVEKYGVISKAEKDRNVTLLKEQIKLLKEIEGRSC